MQISEVRLKKREGDSRFLASGSITFEGQFVVSGIKVMRSNEGHLFVAYPSWKNSDGEYKDVCFPKKVSGRKSGFPRHTISMKFPAPAVFSC